MMTVKPARKSKSQGQALVEFGLILPVLLLIVTGIIDFGQVAITYVQSLSALRNAARFAEVAGFATIPGQPVRYLDCAGMEDAANDILFAGNQNIEITYYKADDYPTTTYKCETVTADALRNGDILEIVSSARVQFITPFVSGIVPDLNIQFTARRTIVKSILLGSKDDLKDTDYDGLDDDWERLYFTDLSAIATGDPDGDGCNNGCEEARGTQPVQIPGGSVVDSTDTDGDRLDDADEAYLYDTDGTDTDTDDDGLNDYDEVMVHKTDPNEPDTDEEGLTDGQEIAGIYPHLTVIYETDPLNPDTDADNISDYDEVYTHETNPLVTDTDGDTLLDGDEINVHHTDPNLVDSDGDTLTDPYEVTTVHAGGYTTLPNNADTDGDGLSDGDELNTRGTKPWAWDSDGDGLSDHEEVILRATNPNNIDTDGDGLSDGDELKVYDTDPLIIDSDRDGVNDGYEVQICGTNPTEPISFPPTTDFERCGGGSGGEKDDDNDGLPDIWEENTFGHLNWGLLDDPDKDGVLNRDERVFGTHGNMGDTDSDGRNDGQELYGIEGPTSNPKNPDTDGDGLSDGQEVNVHGTNPNSADTDADGLTDPAEITIHGTNPTQWDTDLDLLGDGQEIQHQTNPNNVDSDGEGLWDGEEVNVRKTNPNMQDTDGDGLNDYAEVYTYSTNPTLADTDGEGLTDGVEVNQFGTNPNKSDTDGDTLSDYAELFAFPSEPMKTTDPLVADTDLDGKRDDFELANGTMPNNPIAISILPASVEQDNNGTTLTVTVQLDRPSTETTKVRYRTADGTPPNAATVSNGDYLQISSTEIMFLPGDVSKTFNVTIGKQGNGQNAELTDEHFFIMLSDNDNAYISTNQAKMTILSSR
jgi:hypothetical protein